MGLIDTWLGKPSRRKTVAAAPAREAAAAKDPGAEVLDQETSDVATYGTDVGVVRAKKATRKGVPGLGL
jgi:hypothetical protein